MFDILRKTAASILVIVFVCTLYTTNVNAQQEDGVNEGLLELIESINLGFYIDTMYEYNFNDPDSGINTYRSLDPDNNEFEIQEASFYFSKDPEWGDDVADFIGFKIWALLGENAGRVCAAGLCDDTIDLTEGYLSILAPIGNGLTINAGKMTTLAGFELIQAKDNPNITRGFMFGLSEPFTHTGVRASYPVGPVSLTFGINNGWDLVDDNNDGKTLEGQIAYGGELFSASLTGYFGPEQDGEDGDFFGGDWREFFTLYGSVAPIEWLTLSAYADFGFEQGVTDGDLGLDEDDVFWWGVAGYAVADVSPAVSLRLRLEYFNDDDGFRTGVPDGATLYNITPTIAFKPFKGKIVDMAYLDNIEFRVEYRFDISDEDVFEDEGEEFTDTQHTVSAQLLYWLDI